MPDLRKELLAHQALVQRIKEAFPNESEADLADSIEGESGLRDAIAATLRQAREADAMAEGLMAYIVELKDRHDRLEDKADRLRNAALHAMLEIGETKLVANDFTASVVQGKPKVQITGEVPETFCRVSYAPNKTAISDALHAGLRPTWASWSNPQPYLTIRVK